MTAHIREVWRDYCRDRVFIDTAIDIEQAVSVLYHTGQIQVLHIHIALLYGIGYTLDELECFRADTIDLLQHFFTRLEDTTRISDAVLKRHFSRHFHNAIMSTAFHQMLEKKRMDASKGDL